MTDACVKIKNGSGFFAAENYIVTCRHVVAGHRAGDRLEYSFLGQSYPARVAAVVAEPGPDLALLEALRLPERHKILRLDRVAVSGSRARLYGHPHGEAEQDNTALLIGEENEAGKITLSEANNASEGCSGGPVCFPDDGSGVAVGVFCAYRDLDRDGRGASAAYMISAREVLRYFKDKAVSGYKEDYPLEELCYTVSPSRGNPFVYDSLQTRFEDPRFYLPRLQKFVKREDLVRWWAIEGEGGSGKSRLAYELGHSLSSEWRCVLLNKAPQFSWAELMREYREAHRNVLFLADYAHTGVGDLGVWIDHIEKQGRAVYPHRLRILLLQRPGRSGSAWGGPLLSRDRNLLRCRHDRNLVLEPMDRSSLVSLMCSYAEKRGVVLDSQTSDELYAALEKVDESLKRPLFAMFITDAMLQQADPLSWDREAALRYFCNRELSALNTAAGRGEVSAAAEAMWALATVSGGCGFPPEALPRFAAGVYRVSPFDAGRALTQAGLAEESPEGWTLRPMKPDILGEYFVLRYLEENLSAVRELLAAADAQAPSDTLDFLTRAFADHDAAPELVRACCGVSEPLTLAVAEGLARRPDPELLQALYEEQKTALWRDQYLKGLTNSLVRHCRDGRREEVGAALDRFHAFYTEAEKILPVAVPYARAIMTSLKLQTGRGEALRSLDRLRELYADSQMHSGIGVLYAQGLVNYLFRQADPEAVRMALERLAALYEGSRKDLEIAVLFAQGLVNSLKLPLDPAAVRRALERLESLCADHDTSERVAAPYAEGLSQHLFKYAKDRAEAEADLALIRSLAGRYPDSEALSQCCENSAIRFLAKFKPPA